MNNQLYSQKTPCDNAVLDPEMIFVFDKYLVILENKRTDGIFGFFSLDSLKLSFRTGHIGRGPNEFINIHRYFINVTDTTFSILDNGIEKQLKLKDGKLITINQTNIPIRGGINGVVKTGVDSYFMNGNINGEGAELFIVNQTNEYETGDYPDSQYSGIDRYKMEFKTNVAKLGSNIFSFYRLRNLIRRYDVAGNLLVEYVVKDVDIENSAQGLQENSTVEFISSNYVCQNSFYVRYVNEQLSQKQQQHPCLMEWNWDGKITAMYTLNDKYRTMLYAVWENGRRILAIDGDQPTEIRSYNF